MSRCFLFSNSFRINNDLINSLPLQNDDLLVLFNHARPNAFKRVKEWQNKQLFIRENSINYWGENRISREYSVVTCLGEMNERYEKIKKIRPDAELYTQSQIDKDISLQKNLSFLSSYPKNRSMTSGLMGIVNLISKNHDLFLVDFTAQVSHNGYFDAANHFHGYMFEKDFFKHMENSKLATFFYA